MSHCEGSALAHAGAQSTARTGQCTPSAQLWGFPKGWVPGNALLGRKSSNGSRMPWHLGRMVGPVKCFRYYSLDEVTAAADAITSV